MDDDLSIAKISEVDSHLRVCLCDLTAQDMVSFLAGIPISHCAEHRAVKLQTLCKTNCSLRFARVENGVTHFDTLDEASKVVA